MNDFPAAIYTQDELVAKTIAFEREGCRGFSGDDQTGFLTVLMGEEFQKGLRSKRAGRKLLQQQVRCEIQLFAES